MTRISSMRYICSSLEEKVDPLHGAVQQDRLEFLSDFAVIFNTFQDINQLARYLDGDLFSLFIQNLHQPTFYARYFYF
jgi:hypothetical protein